VVIEVHQPDNPRHYRYALDWHDQPLDARPRLLGLAVAEAVDASRIELTAIPEPAPPPRVVTHVIAPPPETSAWTLSVFGARRAFHDDKGFDTFGLGVMPGRTITPHLRAVVDVTAEIATVIAPSGAIQVTSVSSAPQLVYRIVDRDHLHAEVGAGVRVGVARMAGEALPGNVLVGKRIVRGWFGPAATVAIGIDLTPRITLDAALELGLVASGATARDLGDPVASVGGGWTSLRLAVTIPL
ncbi:MAG TPA: hypothetical protein VGO00_23865, partial [Kofleriaceae bacterium]|nr:hypothetical protein [Kofleriaceae bacterium]